MSYASMICRRAGGQTSLTSSIRRAFRSSKLTCVPEIVLSGEFDAVAHLASPASPPDYLSRPLDTLTTGSQGTLNALNFAHDKHARFVLASTSEVYGDPLVHPQPETYWGNVNPVGPRSVYDEAKRFAEALTTAYGASRGVDVGIVRIFNTYGPRMRADDGRAVSTFIVQALRRAPLTVCGKEHTRSFCYVDDLVRGIVAMLDCSEGGPINLGKPARTKRSRTRRTLSYR